MTIGEKVKTARREKGISQKKLAALIGLSELTVIRLEKGQREPRPSELEKIAEVLGVPVASLYDAVPMKSDVTPLDFGLDHIAVLWYCSNCPEAAIIR